MLWHIRGFHRVPRLFHVPNELLEASALKALPTHELFTKLGFVSHPKAGLVHWKPLGLDVLRKVESLAQKHMNLAGAEQVKLSNLSHASLWQQTGRWNGSEFFRLRDSAGNDYCLAPTCEEEITALVKASVSSYKSLPLIFYQINTKFRDEKRPRSGLLRGREFIMKDAYSFDVSPEAAMQSYETMVNAYYDFFSELKLPFVKADADTGEIGGSLSHEWHYVHQTGEDTLFTCTSCGESLNIEKTLSHAVDDEPQSEVAVKYFITTDEKTLVCAYYPSSRTLQPNFLKQELPDIDVDTPLSQDEILACFSDEDTLLLKRMVRIMDLRLDSRSNFPDFPVKFINRSLMTTLTDVPIVEAEEGELCAKCEEGTLEKSRAIEVGHTFFLGDKYSKALDCTVDIPDATGKMVKTNMFMGCYGIGISRIIAAVAEISRDEEGLSWPRCIAPWEATVVDMSKDMKGRDLCDLLATVGVDLRLDSRPKIGLGRKIKESNTVGIPLVVIVGQKYPMVEIEVRGNQFSDDWRTTYESKSLRWEHEGKKHVVHVDDAPKVVQVLLADM